MYGKPKETIEHQQSDIDRIAAMTPEERDQIRLRLEQREARARSMGLTVARKRLPLVWLALLSRMAGGAGWYPADRD